MYVLKNYGQEQAGTPTPTLTTGYGLGQRLGVTFKGYEFQRARLMVYLNHGPFLSA